MDFQISKQPSEYLKQIAKREKALRKQMGYTQAKMAEASDVSLASLSRFEQTGEISFSSLLKIAQILDALSDFDQLFPSKPAISKKVLKMFEE